MREEEGGRRRTLILGLGLQRKERDDEGGEVELHYLFFLSSSLQASFVVVVVVVVKREGLVSLYPSQVECRSFKLLLFRIPDLRLKFSARSI